MPLAKYAVSLIAHSLPTSPATLATPQSAAVIAECDRAWQDEGMRFPTG
ncbi:hypothetical protein NDI39_04335 [Microcoleus sp. ZQ-A2]|nr:hypothetical protein [Microcoleus sp. FACHB-1]